MANQSPFTDPISSGPPHDFEAIYASTTPPWDIGRPQPAFQQLAHTGILAGTVLDVGCGTGEHALLAASLGFDATGVDIAPKAIELARAKAVHRRLQVDFVVLDALDCGLFHVFDDEDRTAFVESLTSVVPRGGRYHMLCFSDRQPGDWGPRRVTQDEIRASFAEGWVVDSIEPAVIDITIDPAGAQAWLVATTRR
jgi:SAM-dependent methyltransferase